MHATGLATPGPPRSKHWPENSRNGEFSGRSEVVPPEPCEEDQLLESSSKRSELKSPLTSEPMNIRVPRVPAMMPVTAMPLPRSPVRLICRSAPMPRPMPMKPKKQQTMPTISEAMARLLV